MYSLCMLSHGHNESVFIMLATGAWVALLWRQVVQEFALALVASIVATRALPL